MHLFKQVKQKIEKKYAQTYLFQRVQAEFTDILGDTFKSKIYKWANKDSLLCSVPDYIMISVNEDGYIKDENGIIHFLSNIVKMDWNVVEERHLVCKNLDNDYRIFYTDEELNEKVVM